MTPERWQQIEKLFHAALELEGQERAAFLEKACGNDESLRREVESLLGQKEKPEGFMNTPVVDQAIRLIAADEDATGPELEIDQRKTPPPPESQETGTLQLAQDHRPGEFGHYRLVRLLGKGGMGEVYEAEDLESGRRVALKILSQAMTKPVDKARFLREGRLAASISHPHCVYVYSTEEIQGTPVIAMERVPGGTLKDRVKAKGPLGVTESVDAILQVISGLEAAAAAGILHRDVKPSNCFIESEGQIKVGDFGLSISTLARDETQLTAGGTVLGTPAFASPEQLRGDELDVRSDIYAVGASLFYLLCGRVPFEEANVIKLVAKILEQAPPSPRELRPQVPKGLAAVVMRCLAKDRNDRFPTYASLTRELQFFGSTATNPATLGLRFLAAVIDFLALSIPMLPLSFLWSTRPFEARLELLLLIQAILGFVGYVLYFSLLEGFWGASLGKAVCGLRVVGPEGRAPGFPRALLRSSIFLFVFQAPGLIGLLILGPRLVELARPGGLASTAIFIGPFLSWAMIALLFSTSRRGNGFAGVHELLSKTRVILKSSYETRPMVQMEREVAVFPHTARRIGPYEVLGSLRASQEHELLAGYDDRLRRKVWITLMPAGSSAVTTLRRDLSRAGRLRWLSGKRTGEDCWDAYEAVEGKPLLAFPGEPQPWRTVRHWLHDLAEELNAALKDKSAPDLGLDRVWITAGGRAKLLEWPGPGLDRSLEESSLTAHEPCDVASAQRFLYRVALLASQGCINLPGKEGPDLSTVPLPLQATSFLKKLGAQGFETSQLMVASLAALVQTAAVVPRWRRCVQLALCLAFPMLIVAAFGFGSLMFGRFYSEHPELFALNTCLLRLKYMQPERMEEQALREKKAMEIFVAARFPKVLSDPSLKSNPFVQSLMLPELRALAERLMAAHPNPTEEEIRESVAVLEPSLRNQQQKMQSFFFRMLPKILIIVLLPELVLGLLSALLFRGGLVLRWLGIAVVTGDGMEASRSRALWRSVIAWSPCAAVIIMIPILLSLSSFVYLSIIAVLLAVSLIGIVAAAVTPARGLQDRLAGTYLVPR
jgi:eukaryotic-like serine/threonine-protein kinase